MSDPQFRAIPDLPTDDSEGVLDAFEAIETDDLSLDDAEMRDAIDDLLRWRNRYVRQVDEIKGRARRHRDELHAVIADELDDVNRWEADRLIGPSRQISRLDRQLERLARWWRQATKDRKDVAKSWNMPGGIVRTRLGSPTIRVTDDEKLLRWALPGVMRALDDAPDELAALLRWRIPPAQMHAVLDVDGNRVVYRATGEVVPGAEVVRAPVSVTINPPNRDTPDG